MNARIVIAIDGYSSCGKSTLARDLARELGYIHIDSGAMYRAVTLHFLRKKTNWNGEAEVQKALEDIQLDFRENEETGISEIHLNNENVERLIRSNYVADEVSQVSTIKAVREFLVAQQRKIGAGKGIVMDGRDIGTVVFPKSELKIFLTADVLTRTKRRYVELKAKGIPADKDSIQKNIEHRDFTDTRRKESPLFKADDALLMDNSLLTRQQQLIMVLNMAKSKIASLQLN